MLAPGLLITGSQLSGKSTLTKILTNYSLKLGWSPIYIDLDLTSNEISPPGTICGALVSETLPNEFSKDVITYFHGSLTPITQEFLFKQISELAQAVNGKL